MTKSQAKRIVCALAVNLLHQREIIGEYAAEMGEADGRRLQEAEDEFIQEMLRRSKTSQTQSDSDVVVAEILGTSVTSIRSPASNFRRDFLSETP